MPCHNHALMVVYFCSFHLWILNLNSLLLFLPALALIYAGYIIANLYTHVEGAVLTPRTQQYRDLHDIVCMLQHYHKICTVTCQL